MTAGNQGKIFISYRRQETAWPARQLYEVLVGRFGAESVFKDVDDIEPGDDFIDKITEAVAACDVLVAMIGNQWLTMTDDQGRRRLDNPEDFVRLEIKVALSRGVRVVPILVDGARMPAPAQLPEDLVPLTRRQAVEINPVGFNTDRLLATLATTVLSPRPGPAVTASKPPEPPRPAPSELSPAPARPAVDPLAAVISAPQPQPVPAIGPSAPVLPRTADGDLPSSPATPELPATLRRLTTVPAAVPPTRKAPSRRIPVLIAAGVALVVLAGALLVLRPWTGRTLSVTDGLPTASGTLTPTSSGSSGAAAVGPMILAHRGGLEVHQFETQQAMEAAAAAGFSVETDVRFTSDGVAVLVHDEKATKGLDCGGRSISVSKTTWSELSKYCKSKPTAKDPAQYPVPRLDATLEGIAAASDEAMVFLEVKTQQSAKQRQVFLDGPAKHGLRERTVVTSFSRSWLDAIRKADPETKRMLFVSGKRVPAIALRDEKLWAVAVEQGIATKQYVEELKAIGVRAMIWVLNDTKQWATFVPFDPDIVMTAYPTKFRTWLANR